MPDAGPSTDRNDSPMPRFRTWRIAGFDEDQYPGRHYEFETPVGPGGVFRSRAYLVNGRLYQLTAVGTKAFATSEQANQFLGSLKLTK